LALARLLTLSSRSHTWRPYGETTDDESSLNPKERQPMTNTCALQIFFCGGLTLLASACGDDKATDPAPPALEAEADFSNENPLSVNGTAEPGAEVEVRGGALAVVSAVADDDGTFEVFVELNPNISNTLFVSQISGGSESTASTFTIIHDDVVPDNPTLEPVSTPTRRTKIALQGTAEVESEIVVTGGGREQVAAVDETGRYSLLADIDTEVANITERELSVQARDRAGNLSGATSVSVVHNPTLPIDAPTLDELPAFTNSGQLIVSGTTESDLEVQLVGAGTVDATADIDGVFSATLDLEANTSTTISVFALVSAVGIASPPAQFVVIHDDIAPTAPGLFQVASPTGATTIRVSGTSESFASIEVSGGAAVASTIADSSGDYSLDVELTADATNTLSVSASDRAGNLSEVTEAIVEQDSNLDDPVVVDPQASPTSSSSITLTGTASPSTDVEVFGGAAVVTVTSLGDGSFSASVPLNQNVRNELRVRHVAGVTETLLIVDHDNVAPASPNVDEIPSPTNQVNISVTGTSEPSARISVSGAVSAGIATADSAGRYAVPVTIAEDTTTSILVISTDRAGNSSSPAGASVTHSSMIPDAPVVDEQSPPPSSEPTHTVAGFITNPAPGITIRIVGGSATATGPTDEATGAFAVEVSLSSNSLNTLEVTSIEGAVESPPSLVSITHDDIAPIDVNAGLVSLGSPAIASCIVRSEQIAVNGGIGSAEAFSTLRVVNSSAGTLNSTTTVNSDGSFSRSILACVGDILRLTSTDAAGNSSGVVEKVVE
jgi:hypothetical protein